MVCVDGDGGRDAVLKLFGREPDVRDMGDLSALGKGQAGGEGLRPAPLSWTTQSLAPLQTSGSPSPRLR